MTKTAETTDTIVHEHFCQPTGDRDEIRIEGHDAPRYEADGLTVAGTVAVRRCLECGAATYDGVPESQLVTRPRPPGA